MRTDTDQKIIALLEEHGRQSPKQLAQALGISPQATHRQLLKLQEQGRITKIGTPPRVYYEYISDRSGMSQTKDLKVPDSQKKLLEDFVVISPRGEYLAGEEAFIHWCNKRKLPVSKTLSEYEKTREKYDQFKQDGLIDGMAKLRHTFSNETYLDELYYLDFYSIERFGKTRLGQLMLYAKQSQNKGLMQELTMLAKPTIMDLIQKKDIDAVSFIPPTVKRERQFMNEFASMLAISLPHVNIEKLRTPIVVPQKTISKLEERVENAQATMQAAGAPHAYDNLLLLDDAVGSGATMNTAAKLLKQKKVAKNIVGFAITGSFKGFEIIAEA